MRYFETTFFVSVCAVSGRTIGDAVHLRVTRNLLVDPRAGMHLRIDGIDLKIRSVTYDVDRQEFEAFTEDHEVRNPSFVADALLGKGWKRNT